jgi:hypothetical protein
VNNLNDLDGIDCSRGGQTGTVDLTYAADGTATLKCVLPTGGCVDDFPDSAATAEFIGTVSGDTGSDLLSRTGRNCDAGDPDWFRFTVSEDNTGLVPIDLTWRVTMHPTSGESDPDLCVYTSAGVQVQCSNMGPGTDDVVSGIIDDTGADDSTSYLIEVYPFVPGGYQLTVRGNV